MSTSTQPREIAILDQAIQMLEKASSLDEIKSVRDKAKAAQSYAQAVKMGLHALNRAAEVKLLAERKAGHFLSSLKLRGGDRRTNGHRDRLNLDDLGISQNESKRWQKLAEVPEDIFRKYVQATNDLCQELTAKGLLRAVNGAQGASRNGKRSKLVPSSAKAAMQHSGGNSSGPALLIAELNDQCQLLASILKPLNEEAGAIDFKKVERRTVERLLVEMSEAIKQLQREWKQDAVTINH